MHGILYFACESYLEKLLCLGFLSCHYPAVLQFVLQTIHGTTAERPVLLTKYSQSSNWEIREFSEGTQGLRIVADFNIFRPFFFTSGKSCPFAGHFVLINIPRGLGEAAVIVEENDPITGTAIEGGFGQPKSVRKSVGWFFTDSPMTSYL